MALVDLGADVVRVDRPRALADAARAVAAVFRTHSWAPWCDVFAGREICVMPALTTVEAASTDRNVVCGTFVEAAGVVQAAPAPRFTRSSTTRPASPHSPGTGTVDALRELDLSDDEVEALRAEGVVA